MTTGLTTIVSTRGPVTSYDDVVNEPEACAFCEEFHDRVDCPTWFVVRMTKAAGDGKL